MNHTWSLAIEEQFYLIWPLVFVALLARFERATPKAVLATSLALAAVSSVFVIVLYDPTNVSRAYFGTDTRASSILLGAALAAWLAIHGPVKSHNARVALEILGLAGAAALAVAWTRLDGQSSTLYHGGFLLCGLAGVAVIAAASHPERGPLGYVLSFRGLCALGLISYGVYLYHWPVDVGLDHRRTGFSGWPLFAFQTVVTLTIAILSYHMVEQPIRRGALSGVQWRKLMPAIATVLVVLLVVATAGGRRSGPPPLRDPLLAATRAYDSAPPGSKRVMIVGDSVGYFLGQALRRLKTHPTLAVLNAAVYGCAFPSHTTGTRLHRANGSVEFRQTIPCAASWQAGAVRRFRPDVVLWLINNPVDAVSYQGKWLPTCSQPYASLYLRSLQSEVASLGAAGARVVMTTEVYPRYLLADEDRATDCENRLRRRFATETGVQLIDLQGYICPRRNCREKDQGVTLRGDGEHFEGAGGEIVARWLVNQI